VPPIFCFSTATSRAPRADSGDGAQYPLCPRLHPKPILFNEDDHYSFDQPENNMTAALSEHASWGYFDYRMKDESFENGFQTCRGLDHQQSRKRAFFALLAKVTGSER